MVLEHDYHLMKVERDEQRNKNDQLEKQLQELMQDRENEHQKREASRQR